MKTKLMKRFIHVHNDENKGTISATMVIKLQQDLQYFYRKQAGIVKIIEKLDIQITLEPNNCL